MIRPQGRAVVSLNLFLTNDLAVWGLVAAEDVHVGNLLEMGNIDNFKRYSYNLLETASTFEAAIASAGAPRTGQLAFRVEF
jgi:hypothetical protein